MFKRVRKINAGGQTPEVFDPVPAKVMLAHSSPPVDRFPVGREARRDPNTYLKE